MMNDLTVTLKINGKRYEIPVLEITTHKTPIFDEIKISFRRKALPDLAVEDFKDVKIAGYQYRNYKNLRVSTWLEEWGTDQTVTLLFEGTRPWRKDKRRWTEKTYEKFFSTR